MKTILKAGKAFFWLFFGTPVQQRRVRQELAHYATKCFGDFPIFEDNKIWREDRDFLANYRRLCPDNPYSQDRKFTLREFARFTKNIPGAMAECGCFEGASAYFMAKECPQTELHLFDSFAGLSTPQTQDTMSGAGVPYWKQGDLSAREQVLFERLKEFSQIKVHKGWIPERFPAVEKLGFRLVHIDVDLYQPTLDSLVFFYPRLSPGGVIVIDDYGFSTCPGAYKAVNDFCAGQKIPVLHLPTGQGVVFRTTV